MKIHYVSGSRADFGLMEKCLHSLNSTPEIDISVVVTGQHTIERYGDTQQDIKNSGLTVSGVIPVTLTGKDGAEMGYALAQELSGFLDLWLNDRPDVVLVLGDRGEMVAAALAAVHLGIFVGHIHGGELSGTLDESFRHVITKLAHFHFPATQEAAERIRLLGENPTNIYVIGAPGLVGLDASPERNPSALKKSFGLQEHKDVALVVFHPVVQEAREAVDQISALHSALSEMEMSQIILRPNSDAGGLSVDQFLDGVTSNPDVCVKAHLARDQYLAVLASCSLMIGNSSSGIIESASFQIPCVNLGSRQNLRQRNNNTVDCIGLTPSEIKQAIIKARRLPRPFTNNYGDGQTHRHIAHYLSVIDWAPHILSKSNQF